ncbi:MAG: hypothetical protein DRH11_13290 [Deltaproteobacteria bacterium]|nr:MAG: hypothetical protein DRH11_13290 [Deltaproteobacteria bacterium]
MLKNAFPAQFSWHKGSPLWPPNRRSSAFSIDRKNDSPLLSIQVQGIWAWPCFSGKARRRDSAAHGCLYCLYPEGNLPDEIKPYFFKAD